MLLHKHRMLRCRRQPPPPLVQARFQYDALRYQRLNVPYVKGGSGLEQATWREAFAAVKDAIRCC